MSTRNNRAIVLEALEDLHIPFALIEHQPMHTIDDCLAIEGIDWTTTTIPRNALLAPASAMRSAAFSSKLEGAAEREAAQVAYLAEHPELRFTLMLLRPDIPFRTAVISKALGISRLSFATQEVLPSLLGLEAGAVSPLGLLFDTAGRVDIVLDEGLAPHEFWAVHPCDNTATVILRQSDLLTAFLPSTGHIPIWVNPIQEP